MSLDLFYEDTQEKTQPIEKTPMLIEDVHCMMSVLFEWRKTATSVRAFAISKLLDILYELEELILEDFEKASAFTARVKEKAIGLLEVAMSEPVLTGEALAVAAKGMLPHGHPTIKKQ